MQRLSLCFVVLIAVAFYSANLCAQQIDNNKFYIGIGGSYVFEDFKNISGVDNTWGANVNFGYQFHPMGTIEFDFDYLDSFDQAGSFESSGDRVDQSLEVDIMTYMIAVKGIAPLSTERVKLFVVVGAGVMTVEATHLKVNGISRPGSEDQTAACGKVGLGFDLFASPKLSIGVEGNYTAGFSDLSDIRYFQLSLGAAFHF